MQICFLTNYFPRATDTSIGPWALSHVKALEKDHDVMVFVITPWIPPLLSWLPRLSKLRTLRGSQYVEGVRVQYIPLPYYPVRSLQPLCWLFLAIARILGPAILRRSLGNLCSSNWTILAHHTVPCGLAVHLHPEISASRIVHWNHDGAIIERSDSDKNLHHALEACFRSSVANIWVSEALTAHARTTWPTCHFNTLLNGADLPPSEPAIDAILQTKQSVRKGQTFSFICAAMFYPRKDHQRLIRAFKKVVLAVPNTSLTLCGTGPTEREIHDLVEDLGLADHVNFLGRTSHRETLIEIAHANCLVLAGWEEPWGVAITEGMSCGLPVIYSSDGGIAQALGNQDVGHEVPPHDIESLASAMIELASNPEAARSLGRNGRALIESELSWEKRVEEMITVLASRRS